MKKADLIDALAGKLGESKAGADRILTAVLESVKEGLLADGAVQITGFGTFKIRTRAPRVGRNPRTGEPVQIAGGKSVGFGGGGYMGFEFFNWRAISFYLELGGSSGLMGVDDTYVIMNAGMNIYPFSI